MQYTSYMQIRSALVTAAGFGTRCLPITKTIQKEMLPILNRPLIDYVVDDLIKAGVERIIMVISEHNSQVLHFYRENPRLVEYLQDHHKTELYQQIDQLHQKAEFIFIRQPDEGLYGTAVPVKLAEQYLKEDEAFFVFMGDDFLFGQNQTSQSKQMLELYQNSGAQGLMTCITKPTKQLDRYGVVKFKPATTKSTYNFLDTIIEKPKFDQAPSNLVNVSKYIMTPAIFELLQKQSINSESGELYITDTLVKWAKTEPIVIYQPQSEYLDGGNPEEWLRANITVAKTDPNLRKKMLEWINQPPSS